MGEHGSAAPSGTESSPRGPRGSAPAGVVSILVLAAAFCGAAWGVNRARSTSHFRMRFGTPTERAETIAAIADGEPAEAVRRIAPSLDDPAPEVRRAALAALEDDVLERRMTPTFAAQRILSVFGSTGDSS